MADIDVPNVEGVPPLPSYSLGDAVLDLIDLVAATFLPPVWGIFYQGVPVIIPAGITPGIVGTTLGDISSIAAVIGFPNLVPAVASLAEFEYSAESPVSNYPQERGAFQSYNKVQMPFDVKVKLNVSGPGNRQALFSASEALRSSTILVDVVTPDRVYLGCNCVHVDYKRTATNGVDLVPVFLWFEEIRQTAITTFSSTQQPGDAAQQSLGNVQPQTTTAAPSQLLLGGAF